MTPYWITQTIRIVAIMVVAASIPEAFAQNIRSPEVHDDGRVTFRLRAADAETAHAAINGARVEMTKGDRGVWEGTTQPLPAGIHDYTFNVDGTMMIDPANRMIKKWFTLASMVEVPGEPPLLTEFTSVPHGVVHRAVYDSPSVGQQRPVMVYTPPGHGSGPQGYAGAQAEYPLVILMHGYGDDETAWTEVGRAHLIADNLIAQGKIDPVVIAMPYGHPVPVPQGQRVNDYFRRNNELYEQDIVQHLLPFLEQSFFVKQNAADRSIVGLSMGGGHALDTGLRNLDRFSAIGAFSAATPEWTGDELLQHYPALKGPNPAANQLKQLFIPIGDQDFLLNRNDTFVQQLVSNGVTHTYKKTSGGHEWKVWRDYLPEFLQLVVGKSTGAESEQ